MAYGQDVKRGRPWSRPEVDRLIDRLERLFNRRPSGWGSRDSFMRLDPILVPIMRGEIQMRLARLPLAACVKAHRIKRYSTQVESAEHAQMKAAALWWMESEGASDARRELTCAAGRADVCSLRTDWIIECGHTRMGKLADAFRDMASGRFSLIPYQNVVWRDGTARALLAVEFVWSRDRAEHNGSDT